MATNNAVTTRGGVGFGGLLLLLFIALKLCGVIGWSWWWVLAPMWLPLAVVMGAVACCFLHVAFCRRLF